MPRRFARPCLAVVLALIVAPAVARAQDVAAQGAKPGEGAWANFDFVPGNKVLFADDFARDRVGNFPQRLELVSGTLEAVDWQRGRWLRGVSDGARFDVPLSQVLPARFTIEFDIAITEARVIYQNVHAASAKEDAGAFASLDGGEVSDELPSSAIFINQWEAGVGGGNAPTAKKAYAGASGANDESAKGKVFRVRMQADGKYVKVYVNEDRVANIPNANFARTNKLRFSLNGSAEEPVYVGNIVVASGGTGMYDALMSDGRVSTQGILFDVGSDRIRGESTPTLKMIGDMLTEHKDLKLAVEGHTDNTGTAAGNMTLSGKRAQAIVNYLVATHHVAADRLTPVGMGQTKPVGSNDTAEGRQANRRVELVKK